MSLRTFHIFFISLSALMCVSAALLIGFLAENETWAVPGIVGSLVACAALVAYGRSFIRRYGDILPKW